MNPAPAEPTTPTPQARRARERRAEPGRPAVRGPARPADAAFSFSRTAVPVTIAAVLALTAASVVVMLGWHQAADEERLTHLEDKLRASVARRMMDHRHGLQSVRGLVLASDAAAASTLAPAPMRPPLRSGGAAGRAFGEAVASLNLGNAFPAARVVGKIGPPEGPGGGRFPVLFAARAAASETAETGAPGLSGLERTPASEGALARAAVLGHSVFADLDEGLFLVMPIHRLAAAAAPAPAPVRADDPSGWVFMRLDRDALFAGLSAEIDGELDFRLRSSAGTTLFDSRPAAAAPGGIASGELTHRRPLQVAGRQWMVETSPSAAFRARPTGDVWLAGSVGVVLACLLAVLQHGQVRLAERAETLARRMTEDLRTAALTDRLTGLANRPALLHRVQESIDQARRDPAYHHAVLFLDFDRFKIINDSLGHQSGDRLLRAIAERIQKQLRGHDVAAASNGRPGVRSVEATAGAAARFGGDEFIVALEGLARPEDAAAVAQRLLKTLAEPYDLGGREVVSTASIGVVLGDPSYHWAEEMVRDADTAMYEAKAAGRAAFVLFDRAMRERVARRLQTEVDLRGATERGEFELFFQPIMRLSSAGLPPRIHRWEALVRWNHPTRGRLAPDAFIGVAEETGLILPIGSWVLCDALRQLAEWREGGVTGAEGWKVGVNLARQQLRGDDLAHEVRGCLKEHGVEPSSLHLEVTETEVMSDPGAATAALAGVRALGVSVDMDDFGTGHSSLSCLDRFPLDVLKIDRSFVADLEEDPRRVSMLSAVSRLATDLGIDVVAEGIETAEQLEQVTRLECNHGQGYFFSRPLPAAEVPAWAEAFGAHEPLGRLGPVDEADDAAPARAAA